MSGAKVDKQWATKGIDTYSTDAIVGTLAHYGVLLDEPGFVLLAKSHYPLDLAQAWHRSWKGTGQFAHFPAAAAEELWRRWCPGQIAPTDVALALVNLIRSAGSLLDNTPDGFLDARLRVVEAYLPSLPDGEAQTRFLAEVFFALGPDLSDELESLATELARAKHDALADRLAAIEEALVPVRAGLARVAVLAARGQREEALGQLKAFANPLPEDRYRRFAIVSELKRLEAFDDVAPLLVRVLEAAQAADDRALGADLVDVLAVLAEEDPGSRNRPELKHVARELEAWLLPPKA